MMDEPPGGHPGSYPHSLQFQLDSALRTLELAGYQKGDRGCVGSIGSACSLAAALIGLGMMTGGPELYATGIVVVVLAAAGLLFSLQCFRNRPPSQDEAERKVVDVAARLTGEEQLEAADDSREALHRLLNRSDPALVVAVLRILSVVGDRRSLMHVLSLAQRPGGSDGDPRNGPDVKHSAAQAAERIQRRLDLAKRSSTLLRPTASLRDRELLRPTTSIADWELLRPSAPGQNADPDFLLRVEDPERDKT